MDWGQMLAGLFAGILGGMGFGGGGILVVFLTVFMSVEQTRAQGINLIFFLPCAAAALIIYARKKLVDWKKAVPAAGFGLIGAVGGTFLSGIVGEAWLSKIFALLFLIIGLMEVFHRKEKAKCAGEQGSHAHK